jgi:hypothetical protein
MTATMKAVVLDEPGPVTNLHLRYLPVLEPARGWLRIKVEAFGLNRSELHTRLGLAEGVTFPRVPGIEATGRVDADPEGLLQTGQQVAAMMGDMGRTFDGGYAEYTVVPRSQVIPFTSVLPWETIGAIPETLQTAYGSLTTGLDLKPGQTLPLDLLVDGGQFVHLGVRAPLGGDAGDGSFHAAEDSEEVGDVRAVVDRHAAPDLRDDLDQALAGQAAECLHDRLLGHPELGLERLDGQPFAGLVLAFEQAVLEQVVHDRGQPPAG